MEAGVALRSVLLKPGLLAVRMDQSSAEMQIGVSAVLWATPGLGGPAEAPATDTVWESAGRPGPNIAFLFEQVARR